MAPPPVNVRRVAVSLLMRVEAEDAFAQDVLEDALSGARIADRDRRLLTELVYGAIRHRLTLDTILEKFCRTRIERLDFPVLEILRTAVYQIVFLDRIPPAAAVNEAVALAQVFRVRSAGPFINAVLRHLLRDIEDRAAGQPGPPRRSIYRRPESWCNFRSDILPDPERVPAEFFARLYSHPPWLVERWIQRFGAEPTTALCRADNEAPSPILRVNTLKTSPADLLSRFNEAGIWAEPGDLPISIRLPSQVRVDRLPGFAEGLFQVQDEGAMLAALFLAPQPEEKVLDLCAAPGGKTTHLAELMRNQGKIIAADISPDRLKMVEENCRRLGITCVDTVTRDLTKKEALPQDWLAAFDAVLLDAPCSNTGVLSRRPEARWRLTPESLLQCAARQKELLRTAVETVRPEGALVYSTCSIEPEENEMVVRGLLAERADLRLEEEKLLLPKATSGGGYLARLRKTSAKSW